MAVFALSTSVLWGEAAYGQAATSPPVIIQVPQLSFQGNNPQGMTISVPELSFQGNNPAAVEIAVPQLSFQGNNPQGMTISVPELSFQGNNPQGIAVSVSELSFQGNNPQGIAVSVPELSFQGNNPAAVEIAVPKLSFQGTGAEKAKDERLSFQPLNAVTRRNGTRDGKLSIRLREQDHARANLRRLTAIVALGGQYDAPRRNGHRIVINVHEGPGREQLRPRETRPVLITKVHSGTILPVEIKLSLRGALAVTPGTWPQETRANAHAWYRFVRLQLRLETADGQVLDRIGPYCYDAAAMRFVSMKSCQTLTKGKY